MDGRSAGGWNVVCAVDVLLLWKASLPSLPFPACLCAAALLTVSEEVRSRCSLKHRKSLLLTDVAMENVPMDTYPIHHSDTTYRLVVSLLPTLQSLLP